MREIYRILDANFNRAREALRVAEDCGRFALNDPAITAMAKNMRSDLKEIFSAMPVEEMLVSRDTPGDIGTELTSPGEPVRKDMYDVATAAIKRLTEALRTIEEYSKIIAPDQTVKVERMRYNAYTLEQRIIGKMLAGRRFEQVRLYLVLTAELCKGSIREVARAAIAGGVDCIQLRAKNRPDAEILAMAAELRELTDETGRMLVINDRPSIAAIVGADGVHLGQHDLPIAESRRLLRPGAIVGRSTHNLDEAMAAVNEGADYVAVGPMFATTTKDAGPIAGPGTLKQILAKVTLPVVAIGGIDAGNVRQVVEAGAKCVAVSSAICCAQDPKAAAEAIRRQLPD